MPRYFLKKHSLKELVYDKGYYCSLQCLMTNDRQRENQRLVNIEINKNKLKDMQELKESIDEKEVLQELRNDCKNLVPTMKIVNFYYILKKGHILYREKYYLELKELTKNIRYVDDCQGQMLAYRG